MKKEDIKDVNLTEETDNSAEKAEAAESQIDEFAQLRDDYVRLQAEFDNYRKRTTREKFEIAAMGGENVIRALLPVMDDIDRALSAMAPSPDREGVEMICKKLRDTLCSQGLSEIEAVGAELDTDLHDAVARIPAPEQRGKVVDVVQKGYKLRDKVVRHAKCVVGE